MPPFEEELDQRSCDGKHLQDSWSTKTLEIYPAASQIRRTERKNLIWFCILGSLLVLPFLYLLLADASHRFAFLPIFIGAFFFLMAFGSSRVAASASFWESRVRTEQKFLTFARCDGTYLTVVSSGIRSTFPVAAIRKIRLSFPILYIHAKGFRFGQKHRMSWFEPEDIHRLITYIKTIQDKHPAQYGQLPLRSDN